MTDELAFGNDVLTITRAAQIALMAVGLVFGYAAASKLTDARALVDGIRSYEIFPYRIAPVAAGLLIACEAAIALAHFGNLALWLVVPGTIALLAAFFVVIASSLLRGERRPCLCFGARRDEQADVHSLVRISLLLMVELALYSVIEEFDAAHVTNIHNADSLVESFGIAAVAVTLSAWCTQVPKLFVALRVLRT